MGTFIFSFVALIALKNGFYGTNGLFVLGVMTVAVLAFVIVTFLRWVDWIARLGRIGTTIKQVESVGLETFRSRRLNPQLGVATIQSAPTGGKPVFTDTVGYVRHINLEALQFFATENKLQITVRALPGMFATPDQPLARVCADEKTQSLPDLSSVAAKFEVGSTRTYDDDPRFALIALSEIASRALSPAVNDPGTAIGIFGSFIRMFGVWTKPLLEDEHTDTRFDRVFVPELSAEDLLDHAFRAIARDGAGIVEVQIRLQKALRAIAAMRNHALTQAATDQSRAAIKRAEKAISFEKDMESIIAAADWSLQKA